MIHRMPDNCKLNKLYNNMEDFGGLQCVWSISIS